MILTVDSSTNVASVSLSDKGDTLYSCQINDGKTHSQKLMPMIDVCFKEVGCTPSDMDAFAVVSGPGSFTGLRIGISAIQGLAYATSKPCISISALDAMAYGVGIFDGLIVPLIDARNSQAYSATYNGMDSFTNIIKDNAGPVEAIAKEIFILSQKALFIGDGVDKNKDIIVNVLKENANFLNAKENYTTIKGATYLAQKYYSEGKLKDPNKLIPYYFRDTSAKKRF